MYIKCAACFISFVCCCFDEKQKATRCILSIPNPLFMQPDDQICYKSFLFAKGNNDLLQTWDGIDIAKSQVSVTLVIITNRCSSSSWLRSDVHSKKYINICAVLFTVSFLGEEKNKYLRSVQVNIISVYRSLFCSSRKFFY